MRNIIGYIILIICCLPLRVFAVKHFIRFDASSGFNLIEEGHPCSILVDSKDDLGVLSIAEWLQKDIKCVDGGEAPIIQSQIAAQKYIIVGTYNKNKYISEFIKRGLINKADLIGKSEKYIITTVSNPVKGIKSALVIVGSDKRGAIYGMLELSRQMGISPWHYWADVPVKKQLNVSVAPGIYSDSEPAVTYRGIFLNDEAPSLTGWANKTFGGYNHLFYEKVFELILRLKGNFMWPAMWDAKFYDDDPQNSILADRYGIIMGTSHHEPMARAHKEWRMYGKGPWNYQTNAAVLDTFWTHGIERMKNTSDIVTIGMRGNGDEPMSSGSNIALLEKIVKRQREIIAKVTGKSASQTPQMWALYKEVQDYYDKGMRVPDDVTLLFSDDNWGNIRKLPNLNSKPRKGGYGIYYHVDYVGDPRNYKWLNVTQAARMWEQLNLTYEYGVRKMWILNVGDLKPMEYPISLFMDMAWNPSCLSGDSLSAYSVKWCAEQFGQEFAKTAADLLTRYTTYNHRVTPELLNDTTYNLHNYNEFARVTQDYVLLERDALRLSQKIPSESKDAFDELILFPIQACANLYELYYSVAMNKDLALKEDRNANFWADKARQCFERDSLLAIHYNKEIANGKWDHMMDQTHIGYTYWQQPEKNSMPAVVTVGSDSTSVYVEHNGYLSIEADHATAKVGSDWYTIPDFGKTLSGVTTMPVTKQPDAEMYLEYKFKTDYNGQISLHLLLAPTLNYNDNKGLRVAVSIDGGSERIINYNAKYTDNQWRKWVANAIIDNVSEWTIDRRENHVLKIRFLDPGIVLEKVMLDMGGLKPSYLGAPESPCK